MNDLHTLSPEKWTAFFNGLKQYPHITTLNLSSNNLASLSPAQWTVFFNGLAQCPHLTTLNLSGNNLASFMAKRLQHTPPLIDIATLILSEDQVNALSKKQLVTFAALFSQVSKVVVLSANGQPATSDNSRYLHALIDERTVFKTCLLNQLEKTGYSHNTTMSHSKISLNQDVIAKIVDFLPNNESITKGLKGLCDIDKKLKREMNIFHAQITPRNPLVSLFFRRLRPPWYSDSMKDLQASLLAKKQAGQDISLVCADIMKAFNAKKNLNPIEQAFKQFMQDNWISDSDVNGVLEVENSQNALSVNHHPNGTFSSSP